MRSPTIIEETHDARKLSAAAQWWRRNVARMTVRELARATGYSEPAIYRLERGYNSKGQAFAKPAWTRYFKALAAVAAAIQKPEPSL